MLYDIAAMQYQYGANMAYRTGDDVYTFDPATPFFRTIWDAGGNDTISVSNFSKGCIVDLRAGEFSKITIEADSTAGYNWTIAPPVPTYDGTDNLAIAYGTTIENAIGGQGGDVLYGNAAANRLTGGAGNDTIDGGAGLDTAIYGSARAGFTVTPSAGGYRVVDTSGSQGTDSLASIERLSFADQGVALDLAGNAGVVAKLLGAVFGAGAVSNPTLSGIGLKYADAGMTYAALAQLAVDARLGAGATNKAVVDLLYGNVAGSPPPAATENFYISQLTSHALTVGTLTTLAADTAQNATLINLVGLAQTGLTYFPA